jgi:hypothetical protein
MRQILVDYAREHQSLKRGGDRHRTTLDADSLSAGVVADEMIGIDRALTRLK